MDDVAAAVTLSRKHWAMVQEALDTYLYEVEHSDPRGLRRVTKERLAARRDELLQDLPVIADAIASQADMPAL